MMATINISVPQNMKDWINNQVEMGEYTSASDYLSDLIRQHQHNQEQLDQKLIEGLNSGASITPDQNFWKAKKNRLSIR